MENIFDGKLCSYYKSVIETPIRGRHSKILDVLTNERYTNQTLLNELRQSGYKSEFYKKRKKFLPGACFSSVQDNLNIDRSDANHLFHSGFIAFDIDPDDNQSLLHGGYDEMKEFIISNIPFVAYLGASVSGMGLWGLIPIRFNDEHYAHYEAMKQYFKDKNIIIDNTCDISRVRFVCYDPDAHFELQPEIFEDTLFDSELPILDEYIRKTPSNEFFQVACKWVEVKHDLKFEPGYIHNYLLRLYSTLRAAHVSRQDCLNWIYNNLIEPDKITTNCLDEIKFNKK